MITLDNMNGGRYAGELQIVMKEQELDKSVNVIGKVLECDMILLKYLQANSKIKIELV